MEYENFSLQSLPRLKGGQRASEHCVQKVEEMLSRAIVHQEDLLDLLMSKSLGLEAHNPGSPEMPTSSNSAFSPQMLSALQAKIENSMNWCHLALRRVQEIGLTTSNATRSPRSAMGSSTPGLVPSYSKAGDGVAKKHKRQQLVSSSAKLKVPNPLSPLHALLSAESPSPSPFTVQGLSTAPWNSGNALFTNLAPDLPSPGLPPGDSSSQQRQWWRYQQQGQNFARLLASLHMGTSDWPRFQVENGPMRELTSAGLIPPANLAADPEHGESTDHIRYESHGAVREDQSLIDVKPTPLLRGNRCRSGSGKSEARKWSGSQEAKLEVVFQKLNDAKKGIPDDGHRGWKKYGNKSIQNSNHCRGYYKCSVKECRAKKMVQPTDKDPTLFEVTYVGKHSCSSTGPRKRSSRSTPARNPAPVDISAVQCKNIKRDGVMQREDSSILTGSNSVTDDTCGENGWTGIIPSKRARGMVEDDKVSLDNFSYLHTMTTSSTSTASEEQVCDASMDTYLHQTSRHHQSVFSFQEPLLWHDFDMDTSLSTAHKPVRMDCETP